MKRTIITSIFIMLASVNPVSAINFDDSMGGKIGPLNVNMDFCEQTDKIAGIANSFSNVRWSIASSAPGMITGLMSKDSVILEFCDFLSRVKSLSYQDALLATAEGGNKILGLGFDDQIALTRSTLDLKDVFLEPSGKAKDFSKLATASNAKKLDNYFKEVADYSDKNNGTNFNVRDRSQIEADMNRLNSLTYKRTVLNEQTNCPKPTNTDANVSKAYESDIIPLNEKNEILQEYVNFYSESLRKMGIKISPTKGYEQYLKDLSDLESKGQRYEISVRTQKIDTTKKRAAKNTNSEDRLAPKLEEYKTKVDKKYQSFAVVPDQNKADSFINKYKKAWEGYTAYEVSRNSNSLLNKPVRLVEDEFKDFSITCNRAEIGKSFNREDPKYDNLVEEEYKKCVDKTNKRIEESGGLFSFYVYELFNNHKKIKENNAYIWTFESNHLGYFRSVDNTQVDPNGYAQEQVACGQVENVAALNELLLKSQNVNTEINQMLVEQALKQNALAEAERERELEQEKKRKLELEIQAEAKRREAEDFSKYVNYPLSVSTKDKK